MRGSTIASHSNDKTHENVLQIQDFPLDVSIWRANYIFCFALKLSTQTQTTQICWNLVWERECQLASAFRLKISRVTILCYFAKLSAKGKVLRNISFYIILIIVWAAPYNLRLKFFNNLQAKANILDAPRFDRKNKLANYWDTNPREKRLKTWTQMATVKLHSKNLRWRCLKIQVTLCIE